ncbi:hypothetical protein KXD40_005629 [Peronospora effusa]|uniref:Uncharacterized protein n=1 Tax=Peronospora effusa TaxID=542832 RepID=A0A3M6VKL2_9STRA|nr:hypothetical protein DD238_004238 [Peronospora effusa]RQM13950.1 hypothetical protein DD237_004702 [Peronospora effusa]UIZ27763.1 hypothetical protein KXD40_005629 [Peronospora effusa]CAI5727553.1 unnamed protein product [Peronospora effusa]
MPRAASCHIFRAQLVMERVVGSKTKLKHSNRHGELTLDTTLQSVQLVYPRLGKFFQRKFEQPLKCVIYKKLMRIYSSNGKRNFMCRLLSDEDAIKCTETLRSFGGGKAALQAIQESSPGSVQAEVRNHENLYQLQDDTEAIMRAMFSIGP